MIWPSSSCSSLSRIFRVISDFSFSLLAGVSLQICPSLFITLSASSTDLFGKRRKARGHPLNPVAFALTEAVAYTSDCLNQSRVGRVLLQLFTQPAHMHIYGAGISRVVVAPDVRKQLITRQDGATVTDKVGQQLELLGLEFQLLAPAVDTTPGQVNSQRTGHQFAIGSWNLAARILGGRFFM